MAWTAHLHERVALIGGERSNVNLVILTSFESSSPLPQRSRSLVLRPLCFPTTFSWIPPSRRSEDLIPWIAGHALSPPCVITPLLPNQFISGYYRLTSLSFERSISTVIVHKPASIPLITSAVFNPLHASSESTSLAFNRKKLLYAGHVLN